MTIITVKTISTTTMDYLIEIDSWLLLAINGINHEYVDPIMRAFSGKTVWLLMYVSIAAVMVWRMGWRAGLIAVAAVGIAVGLSDFICASVIRPFAERLRPSNLENEISPLVHIVDGYRSGRYGFPSCHAANTFALAVSTSLVLKDRKYFIFIIIWAIMQCYSRVYLGVHYPGDLAVGALVGCAMAYLMYYSSRTLVNRYASTNDRATSMPIIIVGVFTIMYIIIKSFI